MINQGCDVTLIRSQTCDIQINTRESSTHVNPSTREGGVDDQVLGIQHKDDNKSAQEHKLRLL